MPEPRRNIDAGSGVGKDGGTGPGEKEPAGKGKPAVMLSVSPSSPLGPLYNQSVKINAAGSRFPGAWVL